MGRPLSTGAAAAHRHFVSAASLAERDRAVWRALTGELEREQEHIELIASENIVSMAVLEAQGSVLTNKYAEGYPGTRHYGGCAFVDEVETLAIERAKRLFGSSFANVQPHSGSQANHAVFMALLEPQDTFMGMDRAAGGHLTHGAPVNYSGQWFNPVPYGVRRDDQRIDLDDVERLARQTRPKLIIAGASAYSRVIDFKRFREIADSVGAYLMVDMAHFAGLVAGGVYLSPFPHAHAVTTTTHKTLRGPRGGLILTNDEHLARRIDAAVFPGLQGGPLVHVIAAKAVALGEALEPSFKLYARAVIENAKALAGELTRQGLSIVSGSTDTHLLVADLRSLALSGKRAETALEAAGITCNKCLIPFDPAPAQECSGIRLGSAACTTRGFGTAELVQAGRLITRVLGSAARAPEGPLVAADEVKAEVAALCARFPIYPGLYESA